MFRSSTAIIPILLICLFLLCGLSSCGGRESSEKVEPAQNTTVENESVPSPSDDQAEKKTEDAESEPESEIAPEEEDAGPKLELRQEDLTLRWMDKGQLRMSAVAKEGSIDEIRKTGSLVDFSAELYEDGKLTAKMKAPKALADTTKRIVTATGGVRLESMERETVIEAEWIRWYAKEQKVVGNGGVKITSSMGTAKGAAFVADTEMKTITMKNSAKGLL